MYFDLLIIVNTVMNFFVLWMVAIITFCSTNFKKLLSGAAIGTMFVIITVSFPFHNYLIWLLVLTVPILMVIAAFYPIKIGEFPVLLATTFGVAFLVGGIVNVFIVQQGEGATSFIPGIKWLLGSCLLLILLIRFLRPYIHDKHWQKFWWTPIEVRVGDYHSKLLAFLDTGNRLKDPFAQKPVILVDYKGIKNLLPEVMLKIADSQGLNPLEALEIMSEHPEGRRFFLIPFSGLKEKDNMLLGFRPDEILLFNGEESWELGDKVVLGVCGHAFGASGEFQALLPPEVMGRVGRCV